MVYWVQRIKKFVGSATAQSQQHRSAAYPKREDKCNGIYYMRYSG